MMARVLNETDHRLPDAQGRLEDLEAKASQEIIEAYRPNAKKVALESAIGNAPCGLPMNPAGLALAARDIKKAKEAQRKLDWFYLLRDVRKMAM
jgi:hypothetical protein